jgi:hypothetical protein
MADPGCPGYKARPYLKTNQSKKVWLNGSSGTVLASQAQRPEFNPKYCRKRMGETFLLCPEQSLKIFLRAEILLSIQSTIIKQVK